MSMHVLFLGENGLEGSARYLASVLQWAGISYDYVPDGHPISPALQKKKFDAVILSDYRHSNFSKSQEAWLVQIVQNGAGLLMIGGWASFTGHVGQYSGSRIEELLPVRCLTTDDRIQEASGAVVMPLDEHDILNGVSFEKPPVICGYHRTHLKPQGQILLQLKPLRFQKGKPSLGLPEPLLVIRQHKKFHSAAFLSDCAPHWAGGLVDWGDKRVQVVIKKGIEVEVGETYLRFWARLIAWLGNKTA